MTIRVSLFNQDLARKEFVSHYENNKKSCVENIIKIIEEKFNYEINHGNYKNILQNILLIIEYVQSAIITLNPFFIVNIFPKAYEIKFREIIDRTDLIKFIQVVCDHKSLLPVQAFQESWYTEPAHELIDRLQKPTILSLFLNCAEQAKTHVCSFQIKSNTMPNQTVDVPTMLSIRSMRLDVRDLVSEEYALFMHMNTIDWGSDTATRTSSFSAIRKHLKYEFDKIPQNLPDYEYSHKLREIFGYEGLLEVFSKKHAKKYLIGNCGEKASIAFTFILKYFNHQLAENSDISIIQLNHRDPSIKANHVVVGLHNQMIYPKILSNDPAEWNYNDVICDPSLGLVFQANQYRNNLLIHTHSKEDYTNKYEYYNPEKHTLAVMTNSMYLSEYPLAYYKMKFKKIIFQAIFMSPSLFSKINTQTVELLKDSEYLRGIKTRIDNINATVQSLRALKNSVFEFLNLFQTDSVFYNYLFEKVIKIFQKI